MSDLGSVYAAFIHDQLTFERARNESLTERGGKLQQSSSLTLGIFVTALGLLLGKDPHLELIPLLMFSVTMIAAILALFCGITVTRLVPHDVADTKTMTAMLNGHWRDDPIDSRNITATLEVETITGLRQGNNKKAYWLNFGLRTQAATLALGVATFAVVAAGLATRALEAVPQ